ncbi:MAG: hypothetical protein GTO00_09255 [Deltaproteobacteria bacterium]|nr:hypothetical protein [Deltaproteobacteria bacterium]
MSDRHLVHTILFLERYAKRAYEAYEADFLFCYNTFGHDPDSMAAYYLDAEMDRYVGSDWQSFLPEIYHDMWEEADRRDLIDWTTNRPKPLKPEMLKI